MRAFRGLILNPRSESLCSCYADGLLVVNDAGQVQAIGPTDAVAKRFGNDALEIREASPPPLILPAFTDIHLHWVQNRIRGTARGQGVLAWLKDHVWAEEARFADPSYATSVAGEFFAELARNGTAAGAVFSSVHETALEAFQPPFGHFLVGNALMTDNTPPALQQQPHEALAVTERWAAARRDTFAVSPRFALSCSIEVLQQAAEIASRHGCFIQTHLAENLEEIALVHQRFPHCRNYTEVYARVGLLGPKTLLAHCIYLDDEELAMLQKANAVVAHCPTSNEALGNGRMPVERLRRHGIRWALATDIAAGPSLSMLHVMKTFLRVHAAAGLPFRPSEALYRATLAGAEALGRQDRMGNLDVGKEANFLTLDPPPVPSIEGADAVLAALLEQAETDFEKITRSFYSRGQARFERAAARAGKFP